LHENNCHSYVQVVVNDSLLTMHQRWFTIAADGINLTASFLVCC